MTRACLCLTEKRTTRPGWYPWDGGVFFTCCETRCDCGSTFRIMPNSDGVDIFSSLLPEISGYPLFDRLSAASAMYTFNPLSKSL